MKKLKLLFLLPMILLTSCKETENIGIHYDTSDGVKHLKCAGAIVLKGGALKIRTNEGRMVINGNYTLYYRDKCNYKCPICGWEENK